MHAHTQTHTTRRYRHYSSLCVFDVEVVTSPDNTERYLVAGRNGQCGREGEELVGSHFVEGAQEDDGQSNKEEHNLGEGQGVGQWVG